MSIYSYDETVVVGHSTNPAVYEEPEYAGVAVYTGQQEVHLAVPQPWHEGDGEATCDLHPDVADELALKLIRGAAIARANAVTAAGGSSR